VAYQVSRTLEIPVNASSFPIAAADISSMTLGGLLKHLALVEDNRFSRWLHGQDRQPPWDTVDWKADPDWE